MSKYVKSFESYRLERNLGLEPVNEEFLGKIIKGALSKLFQAFAAPFKDLVNDIKNAFKEDDPNSIKNVLLTNLNQAIDAAQKMIRTPDIKQVSDVTAIIDNFKTTLTDLANNIGKDFTTAIKDKGQSAGALAIAKAVLLGDKNAGWTGVVGVLDNPNYKYSVNKYREAITDATKGKGNQELKIAQDTAFKFFDNFQKDIVVQLNKELTEEELKKIYDTAKQAGGGGAAEGKIVLDWGDVDVSISPLDVEECKKLYNSDKGGFKVVSSKSKLLLANDIVKISGEAKKGSPVTMTDVYRNNVKTKVNNQDEYKTGNLTAIKVDGKDVENYAFSGTEGEENADKKGEITNKLKEIANKPEDIKRVDNFLDFVKKGDEEKMKEVEKIISGEAQAGAPAPAATPTA